MRNVMIASAVAFASLAFGVGMRIGRQEVAG
jgi:hypothetical protein